MKLKIQATIPARTPIKKREPARKDESDIAGKNEKDQKITKTINTIAAKLFILALSVRLNNIMIKVKTRYAIKINGTIMKNPHVHAIIPKKIAEIIAFL